MVFGIGPDKGWGIASSRRDRAAFYLAAGS